MTLDELKTRVKIKVDEYTPTGVSHAFDDYLGPMIQESADELSDKAPLYLLEPSYIIPDYEGLDTNARWEDDLFLIDAPAAFARIYEVNFPFWEKPVRVALTPEHPDYEKQENTYLKAGYGRPVVYLKTAEVEGSAYTKVIVCGKVLEDVPPTTLLYVMYKNAADMPAVLDEALTWLAASKILQILDVPEQAKLAYDNHLSELMNKTK